MIDLLDKSWRIIAVVIVLVLWGVIVGACSLFDKVIDWED